MSTPNKFSPQNNTPNLLAKFDINVQNFERPDGSWMPMLKFSAAMGLVEFAVLLNPDICRVLGKSLSAHADECEKHIVVPKPEIAQA